MHHHVCLKGACPAPWLALPPSQPLQEQERRLRRMLNARALLCAAHLLAAPLAERAAPLLSQKNEWLTEEVKGAKEVGAQAGVLCVTLA